jgi:DNA-binding beta-propeller fold protein YncE
VRGSARSPTDQRVLHIEQTVLGGTPSPDPVAQDHWRVMEMNTLTLVLLLATAGARGSLPLERVDDIPLPGGPTRFDYQWVDSARRRLYIAHLGADSLLVFDLRTQRVAGEIRGLPSVHGVVAAPERHLLFATITGEKRLAVIDDQTLAVRARIAAGEYPNGLAYDPGTDRVFVSNNSGLGVGVVDVKAGKALPGIDIGGAAGNTQYDASSGHLFVAVHKVAVLAEIDPVAATVVARHPLAGVSGCHGLLVATSLRLAFAACGGDAPRLVVFDLGSHRQLSALAIPPQVDVLAFDPSLRRLYVSSSTGTVTVFAVSADRQVREVGEGFVGPNAHTVAVDPESHRVYFPLENLRGRAVLRVMKPR